MVEYKVKIPFVVVMKLLKDGFALVQKVFSSKHICA